MNPDNGHSKDSLGQEAYYHFYVGLVLGLLTIVLTALLHDLAPVVSMDRLGEDQVQKVYVGGLPRSPTGEPLVLLDFDFPRSGSGSETERLADAIRALAQHHPRAIIVDQEITNLVTDESAKKFIAAVYDAADASVDVVIVPTIEPDTSAADKRLRIGADRIYELRHHAHVVVASDLLHPDADGVIRSFRASDCFDLNGQRISLPTFSGSLEKPYKTACGQEADHQPIRYFVSKENVNWSPALIHIQAAKEGERGNIDGRVRCKIVLLGETAPSDWGDVHSTPLGEMPGVLVHANILLSPKEHGFDRQVFFLGLLAYAALGTVAVQPWFCLRKLICCEGGKELRRQWLGIAALVGLLAAAFLVPISSALFAGDLEASKSISLSMELFGVLLASTLFALQDRYAGCVSHLLWRGILRPRKILWLLKSVVWPGDAAPEGGAGDVPYLLKSFVWLVSFVCIAIVVVGLIALFWFLAGSKLLSFGLRVGSLMPVVATSAESLIEAGKHVTAPIKRGIKWLNLRAACLVLAALLAGEGQAFADGPPSATPTPEPRPLLQRSWSAFTELLTGSPEARSVRRGAGTRNRGDDSIALQWLPTIRVDGATLPSGVSGLTLVWTGGTPPFLVSLQSQSGRPLGTTRSESRLVRLSGVTMPSEAVFVEVSDDQDPAIMATIRPAATAAPEPLSAMQTRVAPTGAALELLVSQGPGWRLEGLRRLSSLADRDPEAARALELIRHTADMPP